MTKRSYDTSTKPTNPKDEIGLTKLPLSNVPASALALQSLAHYDGKLKYGAWNWRDAGVRADVYLDAALRHIKDWQEGETAAPDSGVHHLAHAIACLNIIIDCEVHGKLIDNRPPSSEYQTLKKYLTPIVSQLQEKHAARHPRHFTIADTDEVRAR